MTRQIIFLGALLAASLLGDSITYSALQSVPGYGCVSADPDCDYFLDAVPRFDPTLGTLNSVTWSFTDVQTYRVETEQDTNGLPYSYSTTEGDTSTTLGLDVSATQYFSGLTNAPQEDMGTDQNEFTAYGTAPDVTPFLYTGTSSNPDFAPGYVYIPIDPYLSNTFLSGDNFDNGFFGWMGFLTDTTTLEITYNYTPVPEPRWMAGFGGLLLLGIAIVKRRSAA